MDFLTAGLLIAMSVVVGLTLTQALFIMIFRVARFVTAPHRKIR